jgi:hypothetical protein
VALEAGTRLGSYEILAPLGAGGMGEVYRARDTKLSREVALKTLPPQVAGDSERLGRFQREARLLASLNHPHIAAIYGLEEVEGQPFLVMELVEGEDLAERLKRGPIPVEEALEIASQIAEALEEAHEKGIVHRDLKPANVKVTPDGKAKVLDFGLAKAWAGDPVSGGSSDLSQSPTLTHSGTQAGVILGTAAYMSPEQARGKAVDKRADIWAFGAVLWEMLTGRALFAGEAASDVLAAVLRDEPDLERLPHEVPPGLRRLLRRCLRRDLAHRLRDMGDARLELEDASEEAPCTASTATDAVGPRAAAIERAWTLTTEVCRHLNRESLDAAVIGDVLTYIDNDRSSDVLVVFVPGFGFGHGVFGETLRRSPYRAIAVTPYGLEETRRRRIPLPIADHLTILRLFLESLLRSTKPRTRVLCGFSSSGDVVLRAVSEGGMDHRHVDGVLALSPNLSLETCFFSRRVAELAENDDQRILDIAREVGETMRSPEAWLQMTPYLVELVRKYHSDIGALRLHGRDIIAPFINDGECPVPGWYRAAKSAGVRVRAVFAGAEESEQRPLRELRLAHVDRQVFGPDFDDADIVNERDALHMSLMNPEIIERHLSALVAQLREPRA